MNQIIYKSLIR